VLSLILKVSVFVVVPLCGRQEAACSIRDWTASSKWALWAEPSLMSTQHTVGHFDEKSFQAVSYTRQSREKKHTN